MLNMDTPAGNDSGQPPTPAREQGTIEIPAKLRVHALAKLLGSSSREVINTLKSLGSEVRSAQSNITRDVALQVVKALHPELLEGPAAGEDERNEEEQSGAGQPEEAPVAASGAAPQPEVESASPVAAGAPQAAFTAPTEPEDKPQAPPTNLTPVFAAPEAMFLAPEPQELQPAPKAEPEEPAAESGSTAEEQSGASESSGTHRRRRRRGRRGRGRGRGGDSSEQSSNNTAPEAREESNAKPQDQDKEQQSASGQEEQPAEEREQSEETAQSAQEQSSESASDSSTTGSSTRRRRRRRRRRGSSDDDLAVRDDDPPNTVVHLRDPSESRQDSSDDEVRSVKGSTRLEAKRQRRRDGREAVRRRAPVLTEAEFLARREAVDRRMVVRQTEDQTQIAVLEDNVLVENFVTSPGSGSLVGNVYLGRVQNVLPSMEAAFVDIGRGRNAVLYAGEVDWDAAGLAGKARRIEQALQTGDSVLVQVTKDPVGHKGARLTTQISLPGRFLVYVPGGGANGISRKLPDTERKRLKEILKRIVPDNAGVIIRTASEGTSEEALERDIRRLQAQWEVIKEKAESPSTHAPQLLYEEPDLLIKVVRDLFTEDFSSLTVQGDEAWDTIEAYVQHVAPDLLPRLHKHVGPNDVFVEQRIHEQIAKALDRKVWLPSGGYLVIDRTEAMTVIDVNTGKFTGSGGNLEETVTRNNLEAAEEIVRQLRLRDIGGIIVIDFIDMVLESNRDLVLRRLTECLGRDRTRHQVAEVTSLGLVQMTRKRVGTGLLEAYSSTCEHCRGRGVLVSTDPVNHSHNGSRRNRHRNKHQEHAPAENGKQSRESSEPAKEEAKPAKEEAKPAQQATAEKPQQEKAQPEKAPEAEAERGAKQQKQKPEQKQQPEQPREAVEQKAAEPEPAAADAEPASEEAVAQPAVNGRVRRRATRPAGSAGEPVRPVVLSKPVESSNGESTQELAPAEPVRKNRRAASRPAGPPAAVKSEGAVAGSGD